MGKWGIKKALKPNQTTAQIAKVSGAYIQMSTLFKTTCFFFINLSFQALRLLVQNQEFSTLQLGNDKGKIFIRIFTTVEWLIDF